MINPVATGSENLFRKVLAFSAALIAAIAVLAGGLGFLFAGTDGLVSALIGASIALLFSTLTALSVWLGGKLPLGGFYGVVMGGWLLKVVVFLAIIAVLKGASFINGPVLFFALVASIIGSLAIDSWLFLKARLPIEPK
ncbi:MAG: hypothetical protein ACKOWK_02430 [Micrococcales bacterium]